MVFAYAITGLARLYNVRSMGAGLPGEFAGIFSPEQYERSRRYLKAGARLDSLRECVELAATCAFVLAGGMGWLDGLVRSLGWGEVTTGLAFVGGLSLAQAALINLPFDIYATFVLEARFGFNTTTPAVFVSDRIKATVLAVVLGGGLLAVVLWAYSTLGQWAWLAAWAVVTLFTLLMLVVAPVWILPLFNRFTPLPDGPLRAAIENYVLSKGFGLDGVFVMDGSKRSNKANAFFTGIGKRKRISLYDTLIDKMSDEQVVAVLAHEMGHATLGHVRQGFVLACLKMGLVLYVLQLFLGGESIQRAFGLAQPSAYAGLTLFGLAYQPLALALGCLANAVSRRFEFQADAYAAHGPGGPEALASALVTLSKANLSNLTPHRLTVWLNYSHPPVLERLTALRRSSA